VAAAMKVRRGAWLLASRLGYLDRLQAYLFPAAKEAVRLSPGDFPAGVAAPVGDLATVPLRPVLIGFTPRGSAAALLLATGGATTPEDPGAPVPGGLLKTSYALDARAVAYPRELDVRQALALGAEHAVYPADAVHRALLGRAVDRADLGDDLLDVEARVGDRAADGGLILEMGRVEHNL